jgi:leader peptidase (prepilin peptidase) / N-methyltransferase
MTGGVPMPVPELAILAFVLGACIGSFLNVCISRWPNEQSVVSPPSRCPKCGRPIRWVENIPMVSWLALRARCRGCQERISPLYPTVELLTGLLWLACAIALGPTFDALRMAVFATVMLGISVTDLLYYQIPDGFTVFGFVWTIVTALIAQFLGGDVLFASFVDAVLGACVGAGAIAIAGWLGEVVFKKEAMGFGDVTLMAVVGAAVGPNRALLVVFIGAFIGALVFLLIVTPLRLLGVGQRGDQLELSLGSGRRESPLVPFGVFLAPAALVTLLWGQGLIDWYVKQMLTL